MTEHRSRLLQTNRISPPQLGNKIVNRTRLFEKCDADEACRLLLVNAPAGSGKTVLISSWIAARNVKAAWISLDENSNSALVFLEYLVQALERAAPSLCHTVKGMMHSDDPPPVQTIVVRLVNELAKLDQSLALVLDDYHVIGSKEVDQIIELIIKNIPPKLRVVLLTRGTPGFSISALRLSAHMEEITGLDLRFTPEEILEYFDNKAVGTISQKLLERIEKCTEGWAAGLQLASIYFSHHPGSIDQLPTICGENRLVSEYFWDEIFSDLPAQVRDFLIAASIFSQFSAPLCNYVLQIDNAHSVIRKLEELNIFIFALDPKRKWHRFHQLFREFLQSQLELNFSSEMAASIYHRGIYWCSQNGLVIEAIRLALKIKDFETAAVILQSEFDSFYNQPGMPDLVCDWLAKFPIHVIRWNQKIWYGYILMLFRRGRFGDAAVFLSELWDDPSLLGGLTEEEKNTILGYTALLKSIIIRHSSMDYQDLYQQSLTACRLLPRSERNKICISGSLHQFAAAFIDCPPEIDDQITPAQIAKIISKKNSLSVSRMNYFAHIAFLHGELNKSKRFYEIGIGIADENNLQGTRAYGEANIGLGRLYYEWNDLQKAEKHFSEGIDLTLLCTSAESLFFLWRSVFPMFAREKKYSLLEKIISHFSETAFENKYSPIVFDRIKSMEAELAFARSENRKTDVWIENFLATNSEISSFYRCEWILASQILVKRKQYFQAIKILHRLADLAHAGKHFYDQNRLRVKLAAVYFQAGEPQQALNELDGVLGEIAAEGGIRTVLDEGPAIRMVLQAYLKASDFSDEIAAYAQKILREPDHGKGLRGEQIYNGRINPLTPREIEVLQYLSNGLPYAQIAEEMTISINTVRTYTKRIYQKLQVNNRMGAVIKWKASYLSEDDLLF